MEQVFFCEFCEISKNIFLHRTHLWWLLLSLVNKILKQILCADATILISKIDQAACNFRKNGLQHRCFCLNLWDFLKTPFFQFPCIFFKSHLENKFVHSIQSVHIGPGKYSAWKVKKMLLNKTRQFEKGYLLSSCYL